MPMPRPVFLVVLLAVLLAPPLAAQEGDVDLAPLLERIPEDPLLDTWPNPEYGKLLEWRDTGRTRGTAEDRARLMAWLAATETHRRRLSEDPDFLAVTKFRTALSVHPIFHEYAAEVVSRPPWLLACLTGPDCTEADAVPDQAALEEFATDLAALNDLFRRFMGEAIELPDLGDQRLTALLIPRQKDWEAQGKASGQPLPAGVVGFYSPREHTLFATTDLSGEMTRRRLLHEAAHEIVHVTAKLVVERESKEEVDWSSPLLHSRALWLQEGFAELMSSAVAGEDGAYRLGTPSPVRVEELRATRRAKAVEWSLAELLAIPDQGGLRRTAARKGLASGGRLESLFWAEAGLFCHFLAEKHPEVLRAAVAQELAGSSPPRDAAVTAETRGEEWEAWLTEILK